jgi:hypothetical protein
MILSRLSNAIRTQNWFAVVLEFVIVIAGVVIGFQVTGWAARQADTERAAQYLERLIADMEENQQRFDDAREFRSEVRDIGLEALAYANGSLEPPDSWRVVVAYFNASQSGGAELVDATYREMVATGDLRLLTDLELRGRLSAYHSNFGYSQITDELPAYREDVRAIIPIAIQTYIWENCYESVTGRTQRLHDCPPPDVESDALPGLALQLMQDEALNGRLRYWASTQFAALSIHQSQIETTSEMLERLRQARGTRGSTP